MERKEYTRYRREFKLEAVRFAAVGERPEAQIARELGIWVNQLRKWRLEFAHEERTRKTELIMHCDYKTRDQVRASIFECMEVFCNRQRRHSTIHYQAPLAFEASTIAQLAVSTVRG